VGGKRRVCREMKAKLLPVYFRVGMDEEYRRQLATLQDLLAEEAEFLDPVPIGSEATGADALLFSQILGEAYRTAGELKNMQLPVLIVTPPLGR
jgi:hypothetical protein